jgi:hypothetical protein
VSDMDPHLGGAQHAKSSQSRSSFEFESVLTSSCVPRSLWCGVQGITATPCLHCLVLFSDHIHAVCDHEFTTRKKRRERGVCVCVCVCDGCVMGVIERPDNMLAGDERDRDTPATARRTPTVIHPGE